MEVRGQLGGRSLTWVFPIVGTGEAPGGLRVFSIACPAKSSTREDFEVQRFYEASYFSKFWCSPGRQTN